MKKFCEKFQERSAVLHNVTQFGHEIFNMQEHAPHISYVSVSSLTLRALIPAIHNVI